MLDTGKIDFPFPVMAFPETVAHSRSIFAIFQEPFSMIPLPLSLSGIMDASTPTRSWVARNPYFLVLGDGWRFCRNQSFLGSEANLTPYIFQAVTHFQICGTQCKVQSVTAPGSGVAVPENEGGVGCGIRRHQADVKSYEEVTI